MVGGNHARRFLRVCQRQGLSLHRAGAAGRRGTAARQRVGQRAAGIVIIRIIGYHLAAAGLHTGNLHIGVFFTAVAGETAFHHKIFGSAGIRLHGTDQWPVIAALNGDAQHMVTDRTVFVRHLRDKAELQLLPLRQTVDRIVRQAEGIAAAVGVQGQLSQGRPAVRADGEQLIPLCVHRAGLQCQRHGHGTACGIQHGLASLILDGVGQAAAHLLALVIELQIGDVIGQLGIGVHVLGRQRAGRAQAVPFRIHIAGVRNLVRAGRGVLFVDAAFLQHHAVIGDDGLVIGARNIHGNGMLHAAALAVLHQHGEAKLHGITGVQQIHAGLIRREAVRHLAVRADAAGQRERAEIRCHGERAVVMLGHRLGGNVLTGQCGIPTGRRGDNPQHITGLNIDTGGQRVLRAVTVSVHICHHKRAFHRSSGTGLAHAAFCHRQRLSGGGNHRRIIAALNGDGQALLCIGAVRVHHADGEGFRTAFPCTQLVHHIITACAFLQRVGVVPAYGVKRQGAVGGVCRGGISRSAAVHAHNGEQQPRGSAARRGNTAAVVTVRIRGGDLAADTGAAVRRRGGCAGGVLFCDGHLRGVVRVHHHIAVRGSPACRGEFRPVIGAVKRKGDIHRTGVAVGILHLHGDDFCHRVPRAQGVRRAVRRLVQLIADVPFGIHSENAVAGGDRRAAARSRPCVAACLVQRAVRPVHHAAGLRHTEEKTAGIRGGNAAGDDGNARIGGVGVGGIKANTGFRQCTAQKGIGADIRRIVIIIFIPPAGSGRRDHAAGIAARVPAGIAARVPAGIAARVPAGIATRAARISAGTGAARVPAGAPAGTCTACAAAFSAGRGRDAIIIGGSRAVEGIVGLLRIVKTQPDITEPINAAQQIVRGEGDAAAPVGQALRGGGAGGRHEVVIPQRGKELPAADGFALHPKFRHGFRGIGLIKIAEGDTGAIVKGKNKVITGSLKCGVSGGEIQNDGRLRNGGDSYLLSGGRTGKQEFSHDQPHRGVQNRGTTGTGRRTEDVSARRG